MPSLFLTILVSAVTAGIFSLAVLLIVRQRLGGQLAEVFHRFSQVRDSLRSLDAAVRSFGATREAGLSHGSRLDQLGLAFSRFQHDTARRLTPLVPLAQERERGVRRDFSEREIRQLERHWAPAFGLTIGEDDLQWMLQSLRRTETLWLDDVATPAVDAVGRTLAFMSLPGRSIRVLDAGASGGRLSLFAKRTLGHIFERFELVHLGIPEAEKATGRLPRAEASAQFVHAAAMIGAEPTSAIYATDPVAIMADGRAWDALLLDVSRLAALGEETVRSFLAKVSPGGLVILEGETTGSTEAPLSTAAGRLDGFQTVANAWKTAVIRRNS